MDEIRAAGGLVWRTEDGRREVLVVHRSRYGDWTLPKGKLDAGESWEDAAIREVAEETGWRAEPAGEAGTVSYDVGGRPKVVRFWHMRPVELVGAPAPDEVAEVRWLPIDEAVERLSHEGERALLREAGDGTAGTS